MNKDIATIRSTRHYLLDKISELSLEQLNKTPANCNNNIVWNLGHMIAAQQGICYIRSGLQPLISNDNLSDYRPGTKPESAVDKAEVELIKTNLFYTLDQLEKDCDNNLFKDYAIWSTRYGVKLSSIEDAIRFLAFHEGYHGGVIAALQKLV